MEEFDIFIERVRDYVDRKINDKLAKNSSIENQVSTTLNGYRAQGVHQMMKYQTTPPSSAYTIGSTDDPIVSP